MDSAKCHGYSRWHVASKAALLAGRNRGVCFSLRYCRLDAQCNRHAPWRQLRRDGGLLYKASATTISTTGITATATYDFVNKTLTASDLNGWSLTLPSSTYPIYATGAIASSTATTDDIEPGEWVTPTLFVKDGEDGQPGS